MGEVAQQLLLPDEEGNAAPARYIPGDEGHPWRLQKYIEYQAAVPPIGPATYLPWAKHYGLCARDCIGLAWFNSTCYCEVTALHMLQYVGRGEMTADRYWEEFGKVLVFNSARRYAKSLGWFVPLMANWEKRTGADPVRWLGRFVDDDPRRAYRQLYGELEQWQYMGRFSVELFTDAIVQMSREGLLGEQRFEAPGIHWREGANMTSGLFNVFYRDEWAEEYDRTRLVTQEGTHALDEALGNLQDAIHRAYPHQDVSPSVITPKLCSWRNLFKATRYAGYHHDRQLEILRHYETQLPGEALWERLYALRHETFDARLLGECGGWTGIRPERKRLWRKYGLTGAEGLAPRALLGHGGSLMSTSLPLAQEGERDSEHSRL